jgi:hypothetical protein
LCFPYTCFKLKTSYNPLVRGGGGGVEGTMNSRKTPKTFVQ